MTSPHLSERDLQAAAEAALRLPPAEAAHLHGCPLCQGQVAIYQRLFAVAASLPPPAFEFDLTASVLAQLPKARPVLPWVLGGVAVLVLGVVGLFLVLFGGVLLQALQGMFTGLGAGLLVVVGFLVAGQCLELLVRHRRQMRQLTFS
jgi:hypothetical protein